MVALFLVPAADRTRVTLITSLSSPMSQDLASWGAQGHLQAAAVAASQQPEGGHPRQRDPDP